MIVLIIIVGANIIQCVGSSCYPIEKSTVDVLLTAGLLESVYELANVIKIYRKKGR